MNSQFQDIESMLARVSPGPVPARLLDRIEAGLAAELSPEAKVVPFPAGRSLPAAGRQQGIRWPWLAAAAVAVIGAMVAWFGPQPQEQRPARVASVPAAGASAPVPAATSNLVPAGAQSKLGEVHDEGVVWLSEGHPLRKVRVVYIVRMTLRNSRGQLVEVALPRVQYVFLPERVD